MQLKENRKFVFIVGSPRSGTTLLGEIFDSLPDVAQWYEPYFIWDRQFRNHPHDERSARDANAEVTEQIRKDFFRYHRHSNCRILVDKSPRNSLKIPFIRSIFPEARFIHLLRDGRDVVLSIQREWLKRIKIARGEGVDRKFNYTAATKVVNRWLKRQPFIEDRLRAFWFETGWHVFNRSRHLNRLRWGGEIGWGPKFKDWEKFFQKEPLIRFNARQWVSCLERINQSWSELPKDRKLLIRYEDLLTNPENTFDQMGRFIGTENNQKLFTSIQRLKRNNFNKWKFEMDRSQAEYIHDILTPMLIQLGYESDPKWQVNLFK